VSEEPVKEPKEKVWDFHGSEDRIRGYLGWTLKMEAARSSETLVSNHHTTQSNNLKDHEFS